MKTRIKSFLKKIHPTRAIAFAFALIFTLSSLIPESYADSSAKERVETFISLAAGKSSGDLNALSSLTEDELRFLGVYLSNFYVPFYTELGTANTEVLDGEKAAMVSALTTNLNFNPQVAEALVEYVIGLSRSNVQELEIRFSSDNPASSYSTRNDGFLNYYLFLNMMSGNLSRFKELSTKQYSAAVLTSNCLNVDNLNYAYAGYTNSSGEFIPVFDAGCGNNGKITACMEAFSQCLGSVDVNMGVGTSFFDFTDAEIGTSLEDIYGSLGTWTDETLYMMSSYNTKVVVDCFGNLIAMGGNHQYVIVPACMNPYVWSAVSESGTDVGTPGSKVPVTNFANMGRAQQGILFKDFTGMKNDLPYGNTYAYYDLYSKFDKYTVSVKDMLANAVADYITEDDRIKDWQYSKFLGSYWRIVRGSTDCTIDNHLFGGGTKFMEGIDSVHKSKTSDKTYWMNWEGGFANAKNTTENNFLWLGINRSTYSEVGYLDKMVYIDNLGAFGFDASQSDVEYNAIQFSSFLDDSGNPVNEYFQSWSGSPNNGFTSLFNNIKSGTVLTDINVSMEEVVTVYTTYAIAGLYDEGAKADTIGQLGMRIRREALPEISNSPITLPSSIADDIINTQIRNWVYYLLHPTQGMNYVKILIKNKLNAFLVDWHNSMVGTTGMGITTGSTYYRTNYGYVTTPDLSEISWASSLIDLYNKVIPLLIVFMLVTCLMSFITGVMPFQRAAIAFLIFTCFLFVPVNALNWVVGTANRLTSNIYGEKFTYWAVIQEETYGSNLDQYGSGGTYENYLKTLYATNEANQGGESIVLKWQAPKKMASLMLTAKDNNVLKGLNSNLLNQAIMGKSQSGEAYLDGASQYLYRDYSDIANFSRYIYHSLKTSKRPLDNSVTMGNVDFWKTGDKHKNAITAMFSDYKQYVQSGYTNGSQSCDELLRIRGPLTSDIVRDAYRQQSQENYMANLSTNKYVGLDQDLFNFSIPVFTQGLDIKTALKDNLSGDNDISEYDSYSESDFSALACYGIMSESPFYYYSWKLYDDGMYTGPTAYGGYRTLVLGQDDKAYFYNMGGNGELKDFMDMRSLFTYIIPYLKQGNDIVKAWDDTFGIYVYDGVPTEEGMANDAEIKGDDTIKYKYWHNVNVARLYEIYTPWVDLMYDCSYSEPETVSVMGEKYVVEDPIDPASYPSQRPMIFSESEMVDYGLTEGDLTKVERKILEFNREAQERMYELLNYYNFSDLSLNTAAAINCTFAFNTIFSENGLFSDNINLYPQSFEIKDFSYDAFLRFILANSTGTSMTSTQDFYGDLVNKSSTTTAILLIALDILSQYAIPAVKIFFIIALFLSSIVLILATALRVDPEMRFISKLFTQVFKPMGLFFAITIGFAYVISLFMGTGNNAVTQTQQISVSMGDPNIVMLSMCAIDIVCLVLYVNNIKGILQDLKHNFKMVANFEGGVIGGMVAGVTGFVSGTSRGGSGSSNFGGSGEGGVGETGTGRENPRASSRMGNKDMRDYEENNDQPMNRRLSESRRETAKFEDNYKEDSSRTKKINDTIEEGKHKLKESQDKFKEHHEERKQERRDRRGGPLGSKHDLDNLNKLSGGKLYESYGLDENGKPKS